MAIEGLKKHSGQLSNTGVRVAVVFRKLPNDESSCLIVETERLPDSYHDAIIQCLNSKEAFETNEFYEVLNRRTFPDGTNCLTSLHQRGFLRKEPVSNVTMLPLPNQPVPLALINATIDKKVDEYMAKQSGKTVEPPADTRTPAEKQAAAEALAAKMMGEAPDPAAVAKNLIAQAELLEQDAAAKREEAYSLVPEMKPGRGRPPTPEELKADKLEERKQKRRERDQRKAAEAKVEKVEASLNAKVAAKIARDEARANQA
jgi:hypothetical protein